MVAGDVHLTSDPHCLNQPASQALWAPTPGEEREVLSVSVRRRSASLGSLHKGKTTLLRSYPKSPSAARNSTTLIRIRGEHI